MPVHIARWDLDKTYLRTDFDTFRDLLRTAFERPDEKRTHPGASTLIREMIRTGTSIHILSGSPEQMRTRLEGKLRLDGIRWESFTLKPNLQNLIRLRFRAIRDQLGYKLSTLLRGNALAVPSVDDPCHETLFGDDAEADAFVYSLYADIVAGRVGVDTVRAVCERGRLYKDIAAEILHHVHRIKKQDTVERIFIHLEMQSAPEDYEVYGSRVVPFYNYLQAAFVIHENGRLPADSVLRVGSEMVAQHRFDADSLARSYLDLARRGHLRGTGVEDFASALDRVRTDEPLAVMAELDGMVSRLPPYVEVARSRAPSPFSVPDYAAMVGSHNARRTPPEGSLHRRAR